MKRLISLLTLILFVFGMTGCGNVITGLGDDNSSIEESLPFEVSESKTDLNMGQIVLDHGVCYSLIGVRAMDQFEYPFSSSSSEPPHLSSSEQAIYPIIQVYNASDTLVSYSASKVTLYVDSMQVENVDLRYYPTIDGIDYDQSGYIDPGKSALCIDTFPVNDGWSQITVFYDDMSWTITPDDLCTDEFVYSSFCGDIESYNITDQGTVIYSGDFEIVFDNAEHHTYYNDDYILFEFTLNNTSDELLSIEIGNTSNYNMIRAYADSCELPPANHYMDDSISGYINFYDNDLYYHRIEVHPGMSVQFYIAVDARGDSSVYECYIDTEFDKDMAYVYENSFDNEFAYACVEM